MLVFDRPHPPADGRGRFFIDRGNWTQLDPGLAGRNKNFPFGEKDRETPYREFRMVGLYFASKDLEVTFDLDRVDLESLRAVEEFLRSGRCPRSVKLEYYKSGWTEETFATVPLALSRLDQITRYRGTMLLRRTQVRSRPLSALDGPLKRALEAWRSERALGAFARTDVFERSVILESDSCGLRFARVGQDSNARRFFGEPWAHQTIGRLLTQSADNADYDRNVSGPYRPVLDSGQPHYDQVVASVVRDGALEWTAYDRIILPFEGALASLVQLRPPSETSIGFLAS